MAKSYQKQWRSHRSIIRQRGESYQVETHVNGRRTRETVDSKDAAEKLAKTLEDDLKAEGLSALQIRGPARTAASELLGLLQTEDDRQDAKNAIRLLRVRGADTDLDKPRSTPLAECVRFWLRHHPEGQTPPTLAEALRAYQVKKASRRPATLAEIENKLGRFCKAFPAATVADITTTDMDKWLVANFPTQSTQRKYLRLLHGFFKFICKTYRVTTNPAAGVYLDAGELDQTEVEAYTVDEVRRIMAAAGKAECAARIVPALAIGFFTGLRPSEVGGLDWSNVELAQKTMRVTPATAKRRRQRFVELSDNLVEWLTPYCQPAGPVAPPVITFRRDRAGVLKTAKVTRWLRDGLRHSYGTYHLAAFGDPTKTATEMGHRGNTDLVYQHYRKLVTKDEALKFWQVRPSNVSDALPKEDAAAASS